MATYDRATVTSLLKETYADWIAESYKRNHVLFGLLMEGDKSLIGGKQINIPVRLGFAPGGSPGGESSAYPGATVGSFGNFQVGWTWYRQPFEVSTTAQLDSRNPDMAFLKVMELGLEGSIGAIKRSLARDLYGTRNAAMAVCASNVGATVTVLDAYSTSEDDLRGTRSILKRERVLIVDPATGTLRLNAAGSAIFTVSSKTNTTTVVLDAAPVALAAGDIIVPEKAWTSGGTMGTAIYGLGEIIDNGSAPYSALWGSYGGLDRSAYPELNSVSRNLAGVALAETDLDLAFDAVYASCGEQLTPANGILIAHPSVARVMKGWRYDDVRFAPTTAQLGIDDKNFSYNAGGGNLQIHTDALAIPRCLYGINRSAIQVFEAQPIEMAGKLLPKQHSGDYYDIDVGLLHTGVQVFSDRPHAHFKLTNLGGTDPESGQGVTFVHPA